MEVLTLIPESKLLGYNRSRYFISDARNGKIQLKSWTVLENSEAKRTSSNSQLTETVTVGVNLVNGASTGLGLKNLGNTCFMNCILQCLAHTKSLVLYCTNGDYKLDINRSSPTAGDLITAFAKLMEVMSSGGRTDSQSVSPSDFKSQISRCVKQFVGHSQQDAHEFLNYLLEGLHCDLNRAAVRIKQRPTVFSSLPETETPVTAAEAWKKYLLRNDSKIVDLFVGVLRSTLTCKVCQHESHCFEPFIDLSLPVTSADSAEMSQKCVTLLDCMELFVQSETLDADNRPECGRCKQKQQCTKAFSIDRFPPILILHLKRFSLTTTGWSKLSTDVRCPLSKLDLTRYATRTNSMSAVYNLFAVCNHSGSPNRGHYTAFAQHFNTGSWFAFDDASVAPVDASCVVTPNAYILFYELSDTTSSRL